MTPPQVGAVVTAYEAPDALTRCVGALLGQSVPPAAVFVVDNGRRLPAAATLRAAGLDRPCVHVIDMPVNVGPAGGVAEGLRAVLDGDLAYAWVLDDDCIPDPTCLHDLLRALDDDEVAAAIPAAYDRDGRVPDYPSWAGVLLPRAIVERIGVPREDFFWWCEDTEYLQWRLPRAGYALRRIEGARVFQRWDRRGGPRAAWKYYYEPRNLVYYRLYVQRGRRVRKLPRELASFLRPLIRGEVDGPAKLALFVRGLVDGVLLRMGRRVAVP